MKKTILNIALLSAVLFFNSSCEDIFDYEDDSRWTYDEIFSDYTEAGAFLNTCYNSLASYGASGGAGTFLAVFTDEAQHVSKSSVLNYYKGEMSSSNQIIREDHYNGLYSAIRNCNIFLANIDNVPIFYIKEYQGRWKAEVHILRAYYSWQMIKRYGPMPIPHEEITADFDYSTLVKPTFHECVQDIIADCDAALAYKELKWSRQFTNYANEQKSMTREIAYAIKSQASLYAASPLWNPDADEALYQEALKLTKECVEMLTSEDGGRLKLFADVEGQIEGATNYQDMFLRNTSNSANFIINKEYIMYGGTMSNLWKNYGIPISTGGVTASAGLSPVQELVDAYDFADGTPLLDLEKPYLDADHLEPNYNSALTAEQIKAYEANPYANRDPRMSATIFVNGDYVDPTDVTKGRVETVEGGNCQIDPTNFLYTQSGYYMRKFIRWTSSDEQKSDGTWFHMRLAEMYLNYAEAIMMANNGIADATALEMINLIRDRAEVGRIATPAELTMARLRNERRIELAFEEHRYFDLRRWKLNQEYEGVVTGMNIVSVDDGEDKVDKLDDKFSYSRFVLQRRQVTANKYRLLPISRTDELKYLSLGVEGGLQNPGW